MSDAARVRRIYDRCAPTYESSGIGGLFDRMRARLLSRAHGDVLELGVGAGATFPFYPPGVRSLVGMDVSPRMIERARAKAGGLGFPVDLVEADFQTIERRDATFDTVVASLALCGIPDPPALFSEIRRVLKPSGALIAVEHVRPSFAPLGVVCDLLTPLAERLAGCAWNRRTVELLRAAGFDVSVRERRMAGIVVGFVARPQP